MGKPGWYSLIDDYGKALKIVGGHSPGLVFPEHTEKQTEKDKERNTVNKTILWPL